MFKSIRWKFITIYFLLVFIAMSVLGVFIINELENYYMDNVRKNLTKIANGVLLQSIENFENLEEHQSDIQKTIEIYGLKEEIYIIDKKFNIIASSKDNLNYKNAVDVLDEQLILKSLRGEIQEADLLTQNIIAKNMVFPINSNGEVKGALYLRANLEDINATISESKKIFLKATGIALILTILLGYFIARSITVPITDVTERAEKMAKGDFNQVVEVKSDDEIGRLAQMFNFLREKLNLTLSEMSSEKNKLETILQYMADGLIAVNNEGNIIHANPTAMKMLDLIYSDIKDKPYNDVIKNISESLIFENIKEKNDSLVGKETIYYKESIYNFRYVPYKDERGEKIGIVMVIEDITERQKYENMQKEFVANVSHELKTPLTSIKSYTETLLDGALEDKELSYKFLNVVESESDRMNRLVKDLLQLSRLDYKQEKWDKSKNSIVEIIKNAIFKLEISAKNKKQNINLLIEDEDLSAYVDKDSIEQVILNIISNAIKYTPEGGKIDISSHKNESNVNIIVKDNGIGIPKKDLPRLFERFYRVDKARSRALGGTGLGLSIAKHIVEEHDGSISIDSIEGEGTAVIITLPICG